jgi:hypothetical protein
MIIVSKIHPISSNREFLALINKKERLAARSECMEISKALLLAAPTLFPS